MASMTNMRLKERYITGNLIPVCAWCGVVRDKKNKWYRINLNKIKLGNFELTHGICPKCSLSVF